MNRKLLKTVSMIMAILMLLSLAGCGRKARDQGADDGKQPVQEQKTDPAADNPPPVETDPQASEFPKTMYVTAEEGLLLRDGPGQENEVITLLGYGEEINVERTENGWAYTKVDNDQGWCSMEYLTENKDEVKQADSDDAPIDPGKLVEPANPAYNGFHGYVDSPDGLNMRYGPGTEYDIIMALPDKTEVIEAGWEKDWVYIEYNGKHGWISSEYFITQGGREKPVIYLYPEYTTDVSVKVSLKNGRFTKSIPAGDGEWNVTASPDGKLTDKASGKTYDYIFWESSDESEYDWSKGYVIAGYEAESFLKRILPEMGLSSKETAEFMEYWLPRLQKNSFSLVTFQTTCYTDAVKMDIDPEPDSVLRLFMAFKEVKGPVSVPRPEITPFERKGFTVVEWGGAEIR